MPTLQWSPNQCGAQYSSGLALCGSDYIDPSTGQALKRDQWDEYKAAQLPYQVFSGIGKGFVNEAWKSAMMGSASQWMAGMGVSREALQTPQAQAILYRAEDPFVVGDSPAERASAISGGGSYHAFSAFLAAAGMVRGVGSAAGESQGLSKYAWRKPASERVDYRCHTAVARVELPPSAYRGQLEPAHFAAANQRLLARMRAGPEYGALMREVVPGIDTVLTRAGRARGVSPPGWTWHHHATDRGVMELVPRVQHDPGSEWQAVLHPGLSGGMSAWGR